MADLAKLSVEDLVRLFEDSEDATLTSRKEAERDRDYVDNKQLTAAQKAVLAKRGQPDDIFNHIKKRVNFLVGMEKTQKVDPQALPNTPMHEDDAAGASMALRYVADSEDYDAKRSAVWRNMLVEGSGGMDVRIEEGYDGQPQIKLQRVAWDRMFWDPHSAESDYSDAAYLGTVTWMDYADALIDYPDGKEILDATLTSINPRDTFDDKPKFKVWADSKRKRVRIVQIWLKRGKEWHWAEFTRGGILKGGPSPYKTDKGESDCALVFQSAYVDRDNNRYGDVRELIGPQNAINKGRQKALHLLNTSQLVFRRGAVADIEKARAEAARPDGTVEVDGNPNNPLDHDLKFNTRADLAASHVTLLQEARAEFDVMGPNATMLGDKTGGSQAASGKAIIASQQGGMMQMSDLLDNLRHFDIRVFRAIWARIRQYWTAEKWVRVTDDERNMKWVGVNVDPNMIQQLQAQGQNTIAGSISNVAELDCDITIDDAPDTLTPQLEQFEALVALKQYDIKGEMPFRAIVRAAPNLRNKQEIFEEMDKGQQQEAEIAQLKQQLELANAKATIADTEAASRLKEAQTVKTMREAQVVQPEQPDMQVPQQQDHPMKVMAEIEATQAKTVDTIEAAKLKQAQTAKTEQDIQLRPIEMAHQAHESEQNRAQQAKDSERNAEINKMKAKQRPRAA